jgi:hypothetical protein
MKDSAEGMNTSRPLRFALVFVFTSLIAFIPLLAFALPPLVPCGNTTGTICTPCHIVALAQRVMIFFVFVVVIVAALLFVNAGVLYLFSPASAANIAKAHRLFINTLIGLIIVLASFLFIDTAMKTFYGDRSQDDLWGPWNNILCEGTDIAGPDPKPPGESLVGEDPAPNEGLLHVSFNFGCNIKVNDVPGAIRTMHAIGSSVTIEAIPFSGGHYEFAGWSGACAGQTGHTCTVEMERVTRVGATCRLVDGGGDTSGWSGGDSPVVPGNVNLWNHWLNVRPGGASSTYDPQGAWYELALGRIVSFAFETTDGTVSAGRLVTGYSVVNPSTRITWISTSPNGPALNQTLYGHNMCASSEYEVTSIRWSDNGAQYTCQLQPNTRYYFNVAPTAGCGSRCTFVAQFRHR